MPVAERLDADAQIARALDALVRAIAPASLAGFWPMHDEPELQAAFLRWHEAGVVIALPRVAGAARPLEFGRWHPGMTLAQGLFGTRHPEPHEPVVPQLILLPCLGFDARCYRLGYGGGFYDRTLERCPDAQTVGVAYDDCEVDGFAQAPHDRPLDRIVTDRRELVRSPPVR